jgi:hypothetical protein
MPDTKIEKKSCFLLFALKNRQIKVKHYWHRENVEAMGNVSGKWIG